MLKDPMSLFVGQNLGEQHTEMRCAVIAEGEDYEWQELFLCQAVLNANSVVVR
jgi:hypothetical protein